MLKHLSENKKKLYTWLIAAILLIIMFLLSLFSAMGDSGTTDEIAHIPSGYSYLHYQDYRLNPEHPPLAKVAAGSLLQFLNIKDMRQDASWDGIGQWEAGWSMLYRSGNNPDQILLWARIPMILLAVILGLFVFLWIKKYWGRKAALLGLALYAFYPDILGHSHLVTTDIAAALGFVIALFAFDNLMQKKTTKSLIWAGIAFGIAQLLKFSAVLLLPILLILVFYRAKLEKNDEHQYWPKFWQLFKLFFWTCLISIVVVWLVYIPLVWKMTPAVEHQVIENNLTNDGAKIVIKNILHNFEGNAFTRAIGHYLLGVALVFVRVAGGNATYILGQVSDKGFGWYFPVAWLIKTPLPVIILFVWSLISLAIFRNKHKEDSWQNWLLLTPIVVYWAFTLKGSLNIGIRHLMPTVPFVIILIAKSMKRYIGSAKWTKQGYVIVALVLFMAVEVISYFPQYIAYFNVLIPRDKRYQYLIDSSLDWGQDLLRLRNYVASNDIETIKVDYFGGSVPAYYIPQSVEWHSSYGPTTGWIAVSATYFQSSKLYGPMEGKWDYEWLENFQPETIIGGSILVYHITSEDLAAHPAVSKYPIKVIEEPGSIKVY